MKFTILLLFFISFQSLAQERVNILTWWGYLSNVDFLKLNKECNTTISVDEYYSNSEFLRRWEDKKNSHDIIIFSNTIYGLIKNNTNIQSRLIFKSKVYHPLISEKIKKLELTKNTSVFLLSLSGFLSIKETKVSPENFFTQLLESSKDRIFIIMDDPIEGLEVLQKLDLVTSDRKSFDPSRFNKLKSKIIISNDIEKLVKNKMFNFAYVWSGEALKMTRIHKERLKFQIHPQLSHVTADLISMVSLSKSAMCVYDYLSGKDFLKLKQDTSHYFSPYGDVSQDSPQIFQKFYSDYFNLLPTYDWLKSPDKKSYFEQDESWKKLKLFLNK